MNIKYMYNICRLHNHIIIPCIITMFSFFYFIQIYTVKRRGLAMIFNNKSVRGHTERNGSVKDVDTLNELFRFLKFQVRIFHDYDAQVNLLFTN